MSSGPRQLRVGIAQRVETIDPYGSMDYGAGIVAGQIFQPPFAWLRASNELTAVLFDGPLHASIERPGRYEATLRSGLLFCDGTPVTPADIKRSLEQHWARDQGARVDVQGQRIVFTLDKHRHQLEHTLCSSWSGVSKRVDGELIGSGPYMVADRPSPDELRLVRNPHYLGQQGEAPIEEIIFRSFAPDTGGDFSGLEHALEAGEIDFTTVLPRDAARRLSGVRKVFQPGSSTSLLFMNTERAPLDRADIRRGLARCVDRNELTSLCYENPSGFVARSLLPPRLSRFNDAIAFNPGATPTLAQQFAQPLQLLTIWGPRPYLSEPRAVAKRIASQLQRAGVQVDVHVARDVDDYFERALKGDFDLILTGWIADSADPVAFLDALVSPEAIPQAGQRSAVASNLSRWRDPIVAAALSRYRESGNDADQEAVLERVADQCPVLPICYGPSVTVASWALERFEPHPLGILPYFSEFSFGARPSASARPPSSTTTPTLQRREPDAPRPSREPPADSSAQLERLNRWRDGRS